MYVCMYDDVFSHARAYVDYNGALYIAFGSRHFGSGPMREIGQTVVDCLREAGLHVDWDGNPTRCVIAHIPSNELFFLGDLGSSDDDSEYRVESSDDDDDETAAAATAAEE